jgi:hypothetical protein
MTMPDAEKLERLGQRLHHLELQQAILGFHSLHIAIEIKVTHKEISRLMELHADPSASPTSILHAAASDPAMQVFLFSLAYPGWECVCQPTYAACLHLIEQWWNILRTLGVKEGRFERWAEVCIAIDEAHIGTSIGIPSHGQQRRQTTRHQSGFALVPKGA